MDNRQIQRLIERLASLGSDESRGAWVSGQGDLVARKLAAWGADAERVVLRWMNSSRFRPSLLELDQTHAALMAEARQQTAGTHGPAGCAWCGGRGSRCLEWVFWSGRVLEHRTRAILCDCPRGGWMGGEHGRSTSCPDKSPVEMKTASQTAREMHALPYGTLDQRQDGAPLLLWWTIRDDRTPHAEQAIPTELQKALDGQRAELVRQERQRVALSRSEETRPSTGRRAGAVRRPPEEDPGRWAPAYEAPLRPDRGWAERAEVFGGGA